MLTIVIIAVIVIEAKLIVIEAKLIVIEIVVNIPGTWIAGIPGSCLSERVSVC